MRIREILNDPPLHALSFRLTRFPMSASDSIPICRGVIDGMPDSLEALIVASDLQGIVHEGDQTRSLGEAAADAVRLLQSTGQLPDRSRCGCILAGDLHAGAGEEDVRNVWIAMAGVARWVVGVAGNHDLLPTETDDPGIVTAVGDHGHLLDASIVSLDGLRIGGLGGIIGHHGGHATRTEEEYCQVLAHLMEQRCDLLILHDGPDVPERNLPGWPSVRRVLQAAPLSTLVIRGHDHWSTPLSTLSNGAQVLNVEGRVMILQRA